MLQLAMARFLALMVQSCCAPAGTCSSLANLNTHGQYVMCKGLRKVLMTYRA